MAGALPRQPMLQCSQLGLSPGILHLASCILHLVLKAGVHPGTRIFVHAGASPGRHPTWAPITVILRQLSVASA